MLFILQPSIVISVCLVYYYNPHNTIRVVLTLHLLRVATNLENLEYSGISLNMENSGNSVQPRGKIVMYKVFLVRYSLFKYLCKTAVDWVNRIIRISGSSDPAQ